MRVAALSLRSGDRQWLTEWTRSSSMRAGLAQRARIVLLAADGVSNTAIADLVGVSRARSHNKSGGHVTADVVISERPAEVADRAIPGACHVSCVRNRCFLSNSTLSHHDPSGE